MTVGPTGGLLGSLAGISSGSGSARLGLSQKGDLPSSGEPVGFCWFKVANARMFDGGPRLLARVHDLPGG